MPADRQLGLRQIVPVEIQEIEGEEDGSGRGSFAAASAERALKGSEVGAALRIEHNSFTIQDRSPDPELFGSCRNRGGGGGNRCVQSWPPRVIIRTPFGSMWIARR